MAAPYTTQNPTQLCPLCRPSRCGGMGWAGGKGATRGEGATTVISHPLNIMHASSSISFGQQCLFSTKQGTTQVRKIFKCNAGSCWLWWFWIIPAHPKDGSKKKKKKRRHRVLVAFIMAPPAPPTQCFYFNFPRFSSPWILSPRGHRGRAHICTHHLLQRRQSHGLWKKWLSSPITSTPCPGGVSYSLPSD